jgi:cytosine/adenosine deaminase-related metal-dependent hydrolase
MNNAVGAMAFDVMMREGMNICLGNDGFSNNMWAEWKAAYLLHKVANRDPRKANGYDIAAMAVNHNAALVETFFDGKHIGQLITGAQADLMFVDYHPYTPLTAGNLPWHILFGFEASMVTTTIVDGKILMRDRQLLTLDEQAVTGEALQLAPRVWERYASYAQSVL